MRRVLLVAGVLLASLAPALASDLEPARDAVRRHEFERAVQLLGLPATAGDPEAAFMLAQLLRYGRGVNQDLPETCRLLEQSAAAGLARAAASLAAMLDAGECTASARTAQQWREIAVAGGHTLAPVTKSTPQVSGVPQPEMILRAARAGNLAETRRLLQLLPVDVADEYGRTALMLAAEAGHLDVVRVLLEHDAHVAHTDRNGDSALLLAVRADHKNVINQLLAAGAPANLANASGVTPLMVAARAGSRDLATRLIAAGADTSLRDTAGLRAGDFAARAGHTDLGSSLGATASRASSAPVPAGTLHAGRSPLMIAAERGDLKSVATRLAAGDDINAQDGHGLTALAVAAAAGKEAAIERLLASGAAMDQQDADGWTALGHALRGGHVAAAVVIIHAGADARSAQGSGKTPLLLAVEAHQDGLIGPLVNAGARVDAADASGTTALIAAAAAGDDHCVAALLEAGARPALTDRQGRTALWHSASQGSLSAVRRLVRQSPLDSADAEGTTPLAVAAARGHETVVAALLGAGTDTRIASGSGNLPLHLAAAAGHAGIVNLLARKSGDLDAVNHHQDTALILAVKARCADCVSTLLGAGASGRLRNSDGLNAADVARLTGNPALVQLLD